MVLYHRAGVRRMAIIFRYPAATACRVAGIDKQRFNEAVAHGRYPCAPEVRKGGIRTFQEDDVVALFIFASLCNKKYPPSLAGEIACAVRAKLGECPDADKVSVPVFGVPSEEQPKNRSRESSVRGGESLKLSENSFNISGIRAVIRPALRATLSNSKSLEKRR